MYKHINIEELGTDYTVADADGKILDTIQVIPQTEILEAALGPYTEDFGSYEDYLKASIDSITGYEGVDPLKVLWYVTYTGEVTLSEVIQYAIQHGYDKVILEDLEETLDLEI